MDRAHHLANGVTAVDHELTLAQVVALLAVIGAVIGFMRWVVPFVRKTVHFIDDAMGEEARNGAPARPGMLERLAKVEEVSGQALRLAQDSAAQSGHMARAAQELFSNKGSSLRDAVERIESKVDMMIDKEGN